MKSKKKKKRNQKLPCYLSAPFILSLTVSGVICPLAQVDVSRRRIDHLAVLVSFPLA